VKTVGGPLVGRPSFEIESLGVISDAGPGPLKRLCGYVGGGCGCIYFSDGLFESEELGRLQSQMHTPKRMSPTSAATTMPMIVVVGSPFRDDVFPGSSVVSDVLVPVGSDPLPPAVVRVVFAVPVAVALFEAGTVTS
jgi:hypothetical protein